MSIFWSTVGGALIGLAASWLLLAKGRVAGISGIFGGLLQAPNHETSWRLSFVAGLLVGGGLLSIVLPNTIAAPMNRTTWMVAIAGVLVGYGTRLGNGCTSGHGVCGLSRLSVRSLFATLTFMTTGFITATLIGALS